MVAEVVAAVNSSIGNVTQLGQQTASQGTSEDDETTYPGLEQPLLPQQELRRSLQSIPVDLTLNMSEVRELVVL